MRLRYDPARCSARSWLLAAAGIWIFVKLPQEYWIHIAKLDFTDTVRDYPAFGPAVVVALLVAAFVLVRVVFPRLPAADWGWRPRADALPSSLVEAHPRYARRSRAPRAYPIGVEKCGCSGCYASSSLRSCRIDARSSR